MNSFDLGLLYRRVFEIIVDLYDRMYELDKSTFEYFFKKLDKLFIHSHNKIISMKGEATKSEIYTDDQFLQVMEFHKNESKKDITAIISAKIKKNIEKDEEINKLRNQIKDLTISIQKMEQETNKLKKQINELSVSIKKRDEEINKLRTQVEELSLFIQNDEKKFDSSSYKKINEIVLEIESNVDNNQIKINKPKRTWLYKTDNTIQKNDMIKEIKEKREKFIIYECIEQIFEDRPNVYWFIIKPKTLSRTGLNSGKGAEYENTNPFLNTKMVISQIEQKGNKIDIDNFNF